MTMPVYLSNAEYSHPPEEGPSLPVEGVASYPPIEGTNG